MGGGEFKKKVSENEKFLKMNILYYILKSTKYIISNQYD